MKLWVDDVRPAPEGYIWVCSVSEAKRYIEFNEHISKNINGRFFAINLIDLDHDAGDYAYDGGDYIKLLEWLEETGRNYPIRLHSMDPVGVANMRKIIKRNGWREII